MRKRKIVLMLQKEKHNAYEENSVIYTTSTTRHNGIIAYRRKMTVSRAEWKSQE